MSKPEDERIFELEDLIKVNMIDFYALGCAFKTIKDDRLYRHINFDSFERYVKVRWDMTRAYAYRLISASAVIDNLSTIGETLPENESQARELVKFDKDKQITIWQAFLKSDLTQNARNLGQFISTNYPNNKPQSNAKSKSQSTNDSVDRITMEYHAAVKALLEQIKVAQNDQWQLTSKTAALHWSNVIHDRIVAHNSKE